MFGRVKQTTADKVAIHNFQGIYLSPQQAKALLNMLQQNVTPVRNRLRGDSTGAPRRGRHRSVAGGWEGGV